MSKSVFARLPRFDDSEKVDAESAAAQEAIEQAAAIDAAAQLEARAQAEAHALQCALNGLSSAIDALRVEARQHTLEAIRAISADLFPKLADDFLAEEIMRQLPEVLPRAMHGVEIRAAPAFCTKLEAANKSGPAHQTPLAFVADRKLAPGQVQISWAHGGLDFDAGRRLQASLDRLAPVKRVSEGDAE